MSKMRNTLGAVLVAGAALSAALGIGGAAAAQSAQACVEQVKTTTAIAPTVGEAASIWVNNVPDAAANGTEAFVNTNVKGGPSTVEAIGAGGRVLWTRHFPYTVAGLSANADTLMFEAFDGSKGGFHLDFLSATTGKTLSTQFIHGGASQAWPGAWSGGFIFGQTYQYGPGRGPGSARNMVDIDIYDAAGHLRRGIALSDPDYGGGEQWSVAGSTMWIGVPLTSARTLYATQEAIWRITATAVRRYTVALPQGAALLLGLNYTDVMLYGAAGGGVMSQGAAAWSLSTTPKKLWSGSLGVGTYATANAVGTVYTDGAAETNGTTTTVLPSLAVDGLTGKVTPLGAKGMLFFPWYLGTSMAIGLYIGAQATNGNVVAMAPTGKVLRTIVENVPGGLASRRALVFRSASAVALFSPAMGSRQIRLPASC